MNRKAPPRHLPTWSWAAFVLLLALTSMVRASTGATLGSADHVQQVVETLVKRAGDQPLWNERQVLAIRRVLDNAHEDGLTPSDYVVDDDVATGRQSVTHALARYISDLRIGRAALRTADPELFVVPAGQDLVALLDEARRTANLDDYLAKLQPANATYRGLRELLARYRRLGAAGEWPVVAGEIPIKPGASGDAVTSLRRRLLASGELVGGSPANGVFDALMETAVRQFQSRHGLEADGVVGSETLAAFNVPVAKRIEQIEVNMERWRWMRDDLGSRHVVVNIAGFDLQAVADGRVQLSMRVVVGKPYRRSPVFSDAISYLDLNPTWTPPVSLVVKDILPNARKDREYLSREGFRVTSRATGEVVDPASVDWNEARHADYRFVQQPGPKNALGVVKFMFPNPHNVYLHDTPSRGLFSQRVRIFSSGCIRVEKPAALAAWLLTDAGWDEKRFGAAVSTGLTKTIKLTRRVPIHITYTTVWVDAEGVEQVRPDVYGRDALIVEALRKTGAKRSAIHDGLNRASSGNIDSVGMRTGDRALSGRFRRTMAINRGAG